MKQYYTISVIMKKGVKYIEETHLNLIFIYITRSITDTTYRRGRIKIEEATLLGMRHGARKEIPHGAPPRALDLRQYHRGIYLCSFCRQ
jgi:hypothetical protein